MKKCNLFCIIIILIISMFHSVYATEGTNIASGKLTDYVSWELSQNGELRIYGSNIIPDYGFNKYPWDSYSDNIKSVTIENGITKIPADLFSHKENIETISIPESVSSIGDNAFFYCLSLKSITVNENNLYYATNDGVLFDKEFITLFYYPCGKQNLTYNVPNTVEEIYNSAFSQNQYINEIYLGDSLVCFPEGSLISCENLKSIHIGKSLSIFEASNFSSCLSVEEITVSEENQSFSSEDGVLFNKDKSELLRYPPNKQGAYIIPDGVIYVEKSAFHSSQGLTALDTGNTTKVISTFGFHSCKNLKEVTLRESMVTLDRMSFYNCASLNKVDIKEGLLSIGHTAFEYCPSLTEIIIPASVISISDYAFYICNNLENIYVTKNNENYIDVDGVLYSIDKTEIVCYPAGKKDLAFEVPDTVLQINNGAFAHNDYIQEVKLPQKLNYLGEHSFNDCTALESINIPQNIKSINRYTFYACMSLESVSLGSNITNIDYCAFAMCKNLEKIVWDNGVGTLCSSAFFDCPNLNNVFITNLDAWLQTTFEDVYANPLNNGADLYVKDELLTLIDFNAFPHSITDFCFYGCSSLEKLYFSSLNRTIGYDAFTRCTKLSSVYFEQGMQEINDYAFAFCPSLTFVSIPNSVEYIGNYAFWQCSNLKKIDYYGNEESWNTLITSNHIIPYDAKINYLLSIEGTWINGVVEVSSSQSIKNKTLIIASYNDKVFDNLYFDTIDNDELMQQIDFDAPENYNIKIFVWDSLSNCKPCCSAISVDEQTIITENEINQTEFLKIYSEQGLLAAIESGLYESENTNFILQNPKFAQKIEDKYPVINSIDKFESIITEFRKSTQSGTNGGIYS